jgi:hypothetical protein
MHSLASELSSLLESDLVDCGLSKGSNLGEYVAPPAWQYALQALSKSFLKKFHNGETSAERDNKALELFISINSACQKWELSHSLTVQEQEVFGDFTAIVDSFCHPHGDTLLSLTGIQSGFGLGSGSNIGSPSTDYYSKVALSRLSSTSPSLPILFRHAISGDPTWTELENCRSSEMGHEIVHGSKLSFVPKSSEISRTICTEPVLNMLFQKGIASVIESRLRQVFGIDLSTQPDRNRELAQLGSVTQRFGTIDLKSASDSMSNALIRKVFPRDFHHWLYLTRSDYTTLPGGASLELHMVSSMGNAFTFPLQTALFACLVKAVYRNLGIKLRRPSFRVSGNIDTVGNFAVFGDDIIVVSEAYDLMNRMLSILGFTVNLDKSFNEGPFRESCGHDYYLGCNVRGVYVQTLLDANDCFSAINRLNRWSARHMCPLPRTVQRLKEEVGFRPVPLHEADDAGIKVPSAYVGPKIFNKATGGIVYHPSLIKRRSVRLPDDWDEMGALKRRHVLNRIRRHIPGWYYNPAGLLHSLLRGAISGGCVDLRVDRRRAVIKKRHSSCWNWDPSAYLEKDGFCDNWKVITVLNLGL